MESKPSSLPRFRAQDRFNCTLCKGAPFGPAEEQYLRDLKPAVEAGCPTCGVIYCASTADEISSHDWFMVHATESTFLKCHLKRPPPRLRLHSTEWLGSLEVYTTSGTSQCSLPLVGVRGDLLTSRTSVYREILRSWLDLCEANHPDCALHEPRLPSRILDLGTGTEDNLCLRCCDGQSGKYVALSHCWGRAGLPDGVCTTHANLASRQKLLRLEALPLNFQQAVEVTRAIGVRYLWIDSLCIIQDDSEDWKREAESMALIYHHAFLVIGANCAKACNEGFLQATVSRAHHPIVEIENEDRSLSTIYTQHTEPHRCLIGPNADEQRKGPLAGRGWALQEQLLSRRMVHFESEELFWECRAVISCQCLELKYDEEDSRVAVPDKTLKNWKRALEHEVADGNYETWHACVSQYLSRSLTFPSDFFPALHGIIMHLQDCGAGKNVAGLWRQAIWGELVWEMTRLSSRAVPMRAPTWSWACMQPYEHAPNPVTFPMDLQGPYEPQCILKHIDSVFPSAKRHKTSETLGVLEIHGKLVRLNEKWPIGEGNPSINIRNSPRDLFGTTTGIVDFKASFADLERQLYGLLLGTWPQKQVPFRRAQEWIGLMLRPRLMSTTDERRTYERVGVWTHEDESERMKNYYRRNRPDEQMDPGAFFETVREETITII